MRSLNVPGSPSAPLTTTVVRSRPEALSRTVRHLMCGREPGATTAPQAGGLELVDDGLGLDRHGDVDAATTSALQVLVERSDRSGRRTRCTTVMAASLPHRRGAVSPIVAVGSPGTEGRQIRTVEATDHPGQLVTLVERTWGWRSRAGRQPGPETRPLMWQPHRDEVVRPFAVGRVARTADVDDVDLDLEPTPTGQLGQRAPATREIARVRFGQAADGTSDQAASTAADDERTSSTSSDAGRSAPASMAPDRAAAPPGYWSTTWPARAPRVRSRWLSALRATWVSRCPTLQPGSRLGERASSSVRPATRSSRRAWASATRAMSALGPAAGCSASVIRRTLLRRATSAVWGFGPRTRVPSSLRNGHSDHAVK